MLLKQLEYFILVCDQNSFTEAANLAFISQSAISQQIKTLEQELGVTLLHRQGRSFTLTPAGNYFYRHGKAILKEAEQVKKETLNWSKSTSKIKVKINKRKGQFTPPT